MATRWKSWTANRAVKIISFILAIALCFTIVLSAYSIVLRADSTNIGPGIVLSSVSGGGYFFRSHMPDAYANAVTVAYYKNIASIYAGEHLVWNKLGGGFRLETPDSIITYAWIGDSEDTAELREQLREDAIREQANEFQNAASGLDSVSMTGIIYRISFSSNIYADITNTVSGFDTAGSFRLQPVYLIDEPEHALDVSHSEAPGYYAPFSVYSAGLKDTSIYIAFTSEAVNKQNEVYSAARGGYARDLTIIALSSALLIAVIIIMIFGAGRSLSDGRTGVHFTAPDRLPLDMGAALILFWLVLILLTSDGLGRMVAHYGNSMAVALMLAAATVAVVAPVLLWLQSLAKRVKAGNFWRHTLVYVLMRGILRLLRSLWAGFSLTLRSALIGAASFCMLFVTGIVGFMDNMFAVFILSLAFTAITVVLLLRYARRLHILDEGAFSVSTGNYDETLSVGGGVLGSIAGSITNMSRGIYNAIEQRIKSERLKTELITNVSHDIRTPLTSIITYTDLLKHEGLTSGNACEYLDIIIRKSHRLKTLTDELFEAAKAASGNIEVNITELDLTSLISQVLGELDSAVHDSTLDMRVRLPEQALVRADGKLLWRVMENLMSNVMRYALPGSRVYLTVWRDGDDMRLELKNISAAELSIDPAELTERFKRGDSTRAGEGSGLGLSIVQSFIDAQHGRFSVSIDGDLFKATVVLPAVLDHA